MRRLLPRLLVSALLAGVASAAAQEPDHDLLTLTSGERLVGELIDLRDGRYWMLLTDGRMVSAELRTVVSVEMAGSARELVAVENLPLPDWSTPQEEGQRPIAVGFDFGLTQRLRLRFRQPGPGVAHVDVTVGGALMVGPGVGPALLAGTELALFGRSPVHLTVSALVGPALVWGSPYPFVGVGTGLQVDPKGPGEFHLGVTAGTTFNTAGVVPDLSVSFLW
jgi:hypothetical protein